MEWSIKLRNVPEELRRKAKATASLNGQTLEEFILAAIRDATETIARSGKKE